MNLKLGTRGSLNRVSSRASAGLKRVSSGALKGCEVF